MARKYKKDDEFIGFDSEHDDMEWVHFIATDEGLQVDGFCEPLLTLENATDLHAWLTAYLERTKTK